MAFDVFCVAQLIFSTRPTSSCQSPKIPIYRASSFDLSHTSSTCDLRKVRQPDPRRGKGKRGGLRVIYDWWLGGDQFWLFTVYDKDEADDLSPPQRKVLRQLLEHELAARQ
jgi:hypothetical protein